MREAIGRKRLAVAGVALVSLATAFGVWTWGGPGPERSEAANEQAKTELHLEVDGSFVGPVHCDSRTQMTCKLLKGTTFTVHAIPSAIPVGGYIEWNMLVEYGTLLYKPQANEAKWDRTLLPQRVPSSPTGKEGLIAWADTSGILPPFPDSFQKTALVNFTVNCSENGQTPGQSHSSLVRLVNVDETPSGSSFTDQGFTVHSPNVSGLTVECSADAPVTTTITPTPTGTPTPTNVPLPDLVVKSMLIELETGGACTSTELGVRVLVSNIGNADVGDAGSFVVDVNGAQQVYKGALPQGASVSLWFPGYIFSKNIATADATLQVAESDETNNQLSQQLALPTLPPTCTPTVTPTFTVTPTPTKQPAPGDTDQDGCSDQAENSLLHFFGGLRDYKYFWDFFDVWTHPLGQPTAWERDKVVNVAGDIIGVASRFGPGPTPVSEEASLAAALATPASPSGYHAAYDRGPIIGTYTWDRAPPDGAINIPDDILGVMLQFGVNCA